MEVETPAGEATRAGTQVAEVIQEEAATAVAVAMLEEGTLAGSVTPEGAMLEAKAAATAVAETLEAVMQAPEAATREVGTAAGVVAETPAEGAAREGPIAVTQVVLLEAGETLAWGAMLEEGTPGWWRESRG
jgi:hypothetical protein